MNRSKSLCVCCFVLLAALLGSQIIVAQESPATESAAPSEPSASAETETPESADAPDDAEDETTGQPEEASFGIVGDFFNTPPLSYLFTGGIFMWPILLMGIVGAGVIIERFRSLKMIEHAPKSVRDDVIAMLMENRVDDAIAYCSDQQGPVPAVLATGLQKYQLVKELDYDPAQVEQFVTKEMEDYNIHIIAALERHLPILATISSAAPMLGFLGTVQGMIVAFDDIVNKMGEMNIVEAAASGIKVSLMTTCFGLIVGIPAYVFYNYFTSVINRFILDVEESAAGVVKVVTAQSSASTAE